MAVTDPEKGFHRLLVSALDDYAAQVLRSEPIGAARYIALSDPLEVSAAALLEWANGESIPLKREIEELVEKLLISQSLKKELLDLHRRTLLRADARRVREVRRRAVEKLPSGPPPIVSDKPGWPLFKPNPLSASTPEEFVEAMRAFREWAGGGGEFSARKLAHWSGGAFSHATINKILSEFYPFPEKPTVKVSYVIGFIKACGGSDDDVTEWVTAWRQAYKRMVDTRESPRSSARF